MTASEQYHFPSLNSLAELINQWAERAGFHENVRPFDGMLTNVHSEVSEAQEEWRDGRGMTETYWSWKPGAEMSEEMPYWPWIKDEGGKIWARNYDHQFNSDFPEWLELTPERLRNMPNAVALLKPEGIPSELADVIIRVLHICAYFGIDIAYALADKMAYNYTRAWRNGGKRS